MKEEIWKDVVNFEDYYEVSNLGQIRRKKGITTYKDGRIANFSQTILKQGLNQKGYPIVYLSKNSKQFTLTVHRLVAKSFILNNNNLPQVNHKDCNKLNNTIENLEWISNVENMRHAFDNGIFKERDNKSSNTGKKVINIVTNKIYNNVREASLDYEKSRSYLTSQLCGLKPNKSDFIYYEQ